MKYYEYIFRIIYIIDFISIFGVNNIFGVNFIKFILLRNSMNFHEIGPLHFREKSTFKVF